jgi:hypothetical protein
MHSFITQQMGSLVAATCLIVAFCVSLSGLKQAKAIIQGLSANKTRKLLRLTINFLRWVVGLLKGHQNLKGHILKLGLFPHVKDA